MVKGREWFSVVKKALTPQWKKAQETSKAKQKRQSKSKDSGSEEPESEAPKPLPAEDAKVAEAQNEHKTHAYSVALATSMAATAAVAAARAAMEAVRVASMQWISSEKIAATKIQTAFRRYLVRKKLRALRRLKSLIQGQSIKLQAAATLRCMQTLAHVQSQVRARRLRMSKENQILHQQKQEKEVEKFNDSMGGEWNDSRMSKEQSEAIKQNKQEAAMRRERALAYALSRQRSWKVSSKGENQTLMDPNNPHWGWSWLERWMAARPWEIPNSTPNKASLNTATASSIVNNNNKPSATPSISSRRIPVTRSLSTPSSQGSVSSKIRMPTPRVPRCEGNENSKLDRRHSSIESLSSTRNNEAPMPSFKEVMAPARLSKSRSARLSTSPLMRNGMSEKELEPVSSKIRTPSPRVPRHEGDKNSKLDRRHSSTERLSSTRNDEAPMPSFKEVMAPARLSKAKSARLSTSPLKRNGMSETELEPVSSKIRMPSPRVPRHEGDKNSKLDRRHSSIESLSPTRNNEAPMPSFKEVMAPTRLSKSRSARLSTSPLKRNGMPETELEPVSSKIRMPSPRVPRHEGDKNSKLDRRHSSIESLSPTRNNEAPMPSFKEVMAPARMSKSKSARLSTSPLKRNGMPEKELEVVSIKIRTPSPRVPRHEGDKNSKLDRRHSSIESLSSTRNNEAPMPSFKEVMAPVQMSKARSARLSTSPLKRNGMPEKELEPVSSKIRMPSPRVPRHEGDKNSKLERRHSSIERLSTTRNNEALMPSFKEVMAPAQMSKSRSARLSTSPLKRNGMPEKELEVVSSKIRTPSPRVSRHEGDKNSKLDRRQSSIESLSSTRNNEAPMSSFKEVMAPVRMSKARSARLSTSPLKRNEMPEKELEPDSSKIRMPSPRMPRHEGDKNSKLERRHSSIERLSSTRNDEGSGSSSSMPNFKEVVAPTQPSKARSSRSSTCPLKNDEMPEKGLRRVSSKIRIPSPRVPQREDDENSKSSSHKRRHSSIESVSSTRNGEGFGSSPPMPSFKEEMAPTQSSNVRSSRLSTSPLKQNEMQEKGLGPISNKIRMTSPGVPQRSNDENSKLNHHRRRHSSIESLPSMRNYEGFESSPQMQSFKEEVIAPTRPSKARSSQLSTSPLKQNGMLANAAKKQLSFPVSASKSMKQSGIRTANTKAVVKDVKVKILN